MGSVVIMVKGSKGRPRHASFWGYRRDGIHPVALGIDPGLNGAISLVSKYWIYSMLDLALTRADAPPINFNMASPMTPTEQDERRVIWDENREETRFDSIKLPKLGKAYLVEGSYLSPERLIAHLRQFTLTGESKLKPCIIIIEDVSVQTGVESACNSFKFGQVKGLLSGIVHTLFPSTPIKYLKPSVWKPALGLSRDKQVSLDAAKRVWKDQDYIFKRKQDADRAEAALLALCGLKLTKSSNNDIKEKTQKED